MVPMISCSHRSKHGRESLAAAAPKPRETRKREDLGKGTREGNLGKIRENEYTKNKEDE